MGDFGMLLRIAYRCRALQMKIISHRRRKAGWVYNRYAFQVKKEIPT